MEYARVDMIVSVTLFLYMTICTCMFIYVSPDLVFCMMFDISGGEHMILVLFRLTYFSEHNGS